MSYKINHFETLRQRFPSWAELSTHLQSVEGGSLRVIENADSPLAIIRYTRGTAETGLFRSVVWDTNTNLPVSVAPVKASDGEPPEDVQLSTTEDFVDGVMVNAFVVNGTLNIATRTSIGGNNRFYNDTTFSQMFVDALERSPIFTLSKLQTIMEAAREDQGATACFASFVVQHPAHRVVAKVDAPTMYVVHVGHVDAAGVVTMCERAINWPQAFGRLQVHSYAARRFKAGEAKDMLQRTAVQRGWRWQGLVFKDGAGRRWRLRSSTYTMLRRLRGNEATTEDRFLRLRKNKEVVEYLKHYSEDREAFWALETLLRERAGNVLSAYIDVHKAHTVAFKELPEAYRPAVFVLHKLWLQELREKGHVVRGIEAARVVADLRDFEQKRLMAANPYVAAPKVETAVSTPVIDISVPAC